MKHRSALPDFHRGEVVHFPLLVGEDFYPDWFPEPRLEESSDGSVGKQESAQAGREKPKIDGRDGIATEEYLWT